MTRPRIVVGVDGSDGSRVALRWASSLAPAVGEGAELEVVMAWQVPPAYGWATMGWADGTSMESMQQACESELASVVEQTFAAGTPMGLRLTVREGSAVRVLLERSKNAAMLVVGSRGHGGFTGLLLGSVSARCAEYAQCPVLVVHGDGP